MRVSFQRCRLPAEGIHRTPIRSLGMLPVACDQAGTFCVPVADQESFWLGLSTEKTGGSFRLFAEMRNKHRLNVHSGRPAAEAFQTRLFAPLGMRNTLLPAPTSTAVPAPYARGYM